jgi:hypothetical protein
LPVAASTAYTWLYEVVRNIVPSTTIGAVSIDSTTSVWTTKTGFRPLTFFALICAPG